MRPGGRAGRGRRRSGWGAALAALGLAVLAGRAAAQDLPPLPPAVETAPEPLRLTVTLPPDPGVGSPVVRATGMLRDAVFTGALRDGFPIRFQFRLELWRATALFDRLAREQTWLALAERDPLTGTYSLTRDDGSEEEFTGLDGLAVALAVPYTVDLPLPRRGRSRYYYVASLDVESLSLSELEEVERWLRGDLGRAITREGDFGSALERGARRLLIRFSGLPRRALERGARRLLIRFSGLPRRRLEARTPVFTR